MAAPTLALLLLLAAPKQPAAPAGGPPVPASGAAVSPSPETRGRAPSPGPGPRFVMVVQERGGLALVLGKAAKPAQRPVHPVWLMGSEGPCRARLGASRKSWEYGGGMEETLLVELKGCGGRGTWAPLAWMGAAPPPADLRWLPVSQGTLRRIEGHPDARLVRLLPELGAWVIEHQKERLARQAKRSERLSLQTQLFGLRRAASVGKESLEELGLNWAALPRGGTTTREELRCTESYSELVALSWGLRGEGGLREVQRIAFLADDSESEGLRSYLLGGLTSGGRFLYALRGSSYTFEYQVFRRGEGDAFQPYQRIELLYGTVEEGILHGPWNRVPLCPHG